MSVLNHYEFLLNEAEKLTDSIEAKMPNNFNVELLAEIPGIGRQTAVQLMSMIVDINRVDTSKKISAYVGLVSKVRDSGSKKSQKCRSRCYRYRYDRGENAYFRCFYQKKRKEKKGFEI